MQLTTRQKLALVFSIYVSIFIALVGAVFFVVLHFVLLFQLQKEVTAEATNTLKNHIAIQKDSPVITKDKTGNSLSDEVIETNVSALVLSSDLNVTGGFGLFELYSEGDQQSVNQIAEMSKDAQNHLKSYSKVLPWRGHDLFVYVSPIKNGSQSFGALVAAKSLSDIGALEKIIILTLLGLILFSALASLFLSRFLVEKIYRPIRELTKVISNTSLDKLESSLEVPGHKSDELVVLTDKFNAMLTRLKSMSEQQKEFISNASHELKTPLSRVISSLDLATSSTTNPVNLLKDLRDELFGINSLLDKLMFLSKLKPGTTPRSDKLSLERLITDCIQPLKKNPKNINFELDLETGASIFLPKEYAEVLLTNLLSNAIKYSRPGSTIFLRTSSDGVLEITDQGMGIEKSELKKVQERFFRGEGGKSVSGHGIGLSIVRRIVELYKIKFSIESAPDKGTKVTLQFPTVP